MGVCAIVLAAGEGKRMRSGMPKVLTEVLFKPMLRWVLDACVNTNITDICVVTGFRHELIEDYLNEVPIECKTIIQEERKGTAHAVMLAKSFLLEHIDDDVLILGGDSPFIDADTIQRAYELHLSSQNAVTVISSEVESPLGYGRIVRDECLNLTCIVEEKDASDEIRMISEVNSGAYWFNVSKLLSVIFNISNDTAQKEYYLPDAVKLLLEGNQNVGAYKTDCKDVVLGANSLMELANLNEIARKNKIESLINDGVLIPCSDGIMISVDTSIAFGTKILPNTILRGINNIGKDCVVGPNTQLLNCTVEDRCILNSVYAENTELSAYDEIKPFTCIIP